MFVNEISNALAALDAQHNAFKEQLTQRFNDNIGTIETKKATLPDWAQHIINAQLAQNPVFILMGYFESVHSAYEGIELAKQFQSLSSWKTWLENPEKSLVQPTITGQHTQETFMYMLKFANEYMRRNHSEIVIAQ